MRNSVQQLHTVCVYNGNILCVDSWVWLILALFHLLYCVALAFDYISMFNAVVCVTVTD